MRADAVVYVNGAFIVRYAVRGQPSPRMVWSVGNMTLTPKGLTLTDRSARTFLPLEAIGMVGPPPTTMLPPPVGMEQVLAVHHVENGAPCVTMIAFAAVTVNNFPMQLAGALTGTVNAFAPSLGPSGEAAYEPVSFEFDVDRIRLGTRAGQREIPLDAISTLTPSRGRDQRGRDFVEWSIDYVAGGAISTLRLLSYERVQFLVPLLLSIQSLRRSSALGRGSRPTDALSETAQQVAALLYTGGVSAASIEQMLAITGDKVDAAYEELLRLGLADVVRVRKEVALNAAGMKAVDEIMKRQMENPTL